MESANKPAAAGARPLSPHLQIWRWNVTMAASITHRATGMALAAGTLFLAWWIIAAGMGTDAYDTFTRVAVHPIGQVILFAFIWSLAFHFLNGIRHLAWDIGYGFAVRTAFATGVIVFVLSFALAALVFLVGRGLL
ncbi:MAG: succinate dehydrogenase, cytochrome b556 subunit [Alphaproteobacteria bacterium]